jgi:uncharacterized integral membrane protein
MSIVLLIACVATLLVVLNWSVFGADSTFYLIFGSVTLPIGLVVLGSVIATAVAVGLTVGIWRGNLLVEYRRQSKELGAQRTLAESAEASRLTELGQTVREELAKQDARFNVAFAALRAEIRDSTNSLAAVLGELDDRLQRDAASLSATAGPSKFVGPNECPRSGSGPEAGQAKTKHDKSFSIAAWVSGRNSRELTGSRVVR